MPKTAENKHTLLTLKQASDALNVHKNTLREWDNKGVLKAVRFGVRKDRRYRKADIARLAGQQEKV